MKSYGLSFRFVCSASKLHANFFRSLLFNAFDTISLNIFSSIYCGDDDDLRYEIILYENGNKYTAKSQLTIECSRNLNIQTACIFQLQSRAKKCFFAFAVEHTNRINDQ